MKIRIDFLDNDIDINSDYIFNIECENKIYFYRIVGLFNSLADEDIDDTLKVYNNDEEINCSGKMQVIIDYFNINLSLKKYQNKLNELVMSSIDSDDINKLGNEFKKIEKIINHNLEKIDIPVIIQKEITLDSLIKLLKLEIKCNNNILENLLLLIDIEKTFHINKFLVFVNLKQYLSSIEINELYKYSMYNEIPILLIDSQSYGVANEYEKKLIIDDNLNEFMI